MQPVHAPRLPVAEPAPARRVLLAAPYAPSGGGMGRIMAYLAANPPPGATTFETLESRGAGSALLSAAFAARAALHITAARGTDSIVHVNMAEGSSIFRKGALIFAARAAGLPTLLHLHAADIIRFAARCPAPARLLMQQIFQAADLCVVLGQPWVAWAEHDMGVPPSRIAVLRNGVPRPHVARFPAGAHEPSLLFLGNMLPRKGLPDLLAALGLIAGRRWTLTVAGGGDPASLAARAHSLGIGARVRFVGWQDRAQVTALLARATALILPSYAEGLPLVLLEAASLGVPIVTTPVGAVGEVFTDGDTALLVRPGDTLGLASAIARLIEDPALRDRLGNRARALHARNHTMEAFGANLLDLYSRIPAR